VHLATKLGSFDSARESLAATTEVELTRGGEAMLQLRAEQLSDTQPLEVHWGHRSQNATGTRTHTSAA
jgi:hypothetical protein